MMDIGNCLSVASNVFSKLNINHLIERLLHMSPSWNLGWSVLLGMFIFRLG